MSDEAIDVTPAPSGTGTSPTASFVPASAARFLRADHHILAALAATVLEAVVNGDRTEAGDAIAAMQRSVLGHLAEEERELLPEYARHAPEDARAILDDHTAIRAALADFDVATDLHFLRANVVEAFLARLRTHAAREDEGLYRWAAAR